MPYSGTEIANWELGRRQLAQERNNALLRAALERMQSRRGAVQFDAQQEMAAKQFAAQMLERKADNDRQAARDKMTGDYYKAQMKRWEDEQKANANAVPEDKRSAIERLIDDNMASGMSRQEATAKAYQATRAPEKPDKPDKPNQPPASQTPLALQLSFMDDAIKAYDDIAARASSSASKLTKGERANALEQARRAGLARDRIMAARGDAAAKSAPLPPDEFNKVRAIASSVDKTLKEAAWWEPKPAATVSSKKKQSGGGWGEASGTVKKSMSAEKPPINNDTISRYMKMYPDRTQGEIVKAIVEQYYA